MAEANLVTQFAPYIVTLLLGGVGGIAWWLERGKTILAKLRKIMKRRMKQYRRLNHWKNPITNCSDSGD